VINALLFLVAAAASPAAAPQKNAGPPCPEVTVLKERVATLEQENSQLKSRSIELLFAVAAVPKEPSPDEKAFNEAVAALRSLKVATQGSIIDFRRYFLDAAAKVEAVPASHPRKNALRSAVNVYSDANTLFGLGAKANSSVLDEQTWKAIRAKYPSENLSPGCDGVRVFGTESALSATFTSCGLTLCTLAENQLGSAL